MRGLKINKILSLFMCLIIVTLNILLEHFYAPHGIDFTPIAVILVTTLLNITEDKFNIWLRIVLTYFLIGMNDVGIKLYGGGMHDLEGQAFVFFFLLIGLIPAFLIISITVFKDKKLPILSKIISLLMFIILIGLHSYVFENLGTGRYDPIFNLP